ncbi:MAG: tRNA-dihydrouridine synthase family protein, partial [Planctomycetes bacterium]|nr:tRNA-dihydrouridine synthase family protein [Planctomycetota bacterium]
MLKIGNIEFKLPIFQSAISGYSDRAMREMARRFGAELTFSGLMLDKSVAHWRMWRQSHYVIKDNEHPIGGQLLGSEPRKMVQAALILQEKGYDLIDLNFACPAPKVVARERGGYLLNQPDRVIEIFQRVRQAINLPLTLKLRSSFFQGDQDKESLWQICEAADAEGIDGVTIHGRSVKQRYRGTGDWDIIAAVKQRLKNMTVIGSGDLYTAETIIERLNHSGVNGAVIARGAIGNPWIFKHVRCLWEGNGAWQEPDIDEQKDVLLQHFEMILELYPPKKAIPFFRK